MPGRSRGLPGASTARVRAFAQQWGTMSGETGNDLRRASSPHLTPTRGHPQPDQPGGRPGRAHRQAGRRITASDVGWDLHRPRNRHHHLDTPGDAPWRLRSTKSARETSWTAETYSCSPKRQPPRPLSHSCSARSGGQRRASRHAPEREARSLDRKRRPGPPGDGRLHRERQRRPHLGPRHLAEHFPGGVDWMLFDARQHPQAQRVYHTGIRLAREAGTSLTTRHSTTNLVTSAAYRPRGWATTTTLPRSWTSPRGRRSCRPLWPPSGVYTPQGSGTILKRSSGSGRVGSSGPGSRGHGLPGRPLHQ